MSVLDGSDAEMRMVAMVEIGQCPFGDFENSKAMGLYWFNEDHQVSITSLTSPASPASLTSLTGPVGEPL